MTCRPARFPDDEKFIVSGWSSSYRMSEDLAFVQMADYAEHMHAVVRSVIARPRARVIVNEGEVLRGFICFEMSEIGAPPLVHYVYVAQLYRRRRFARALFAAAGIDPAQPFEFAARTPASWQLLVVHRKAPLARFNSLRARFAEERKHHG